MSTHPVPTKIGRYEILGELGKGAMGVVYLGRDPIIGRQLALKTFKSQMSANDPDFVQFRERFLREAQSAGILSHPNIVTIHDVVDDVVEGMTFIAMEFIRGTDLRAFLKEQGGRVDPAKAADILDQVAAGLDYAHSMGVVHRDIKPANVLMTTDGRAKITDFGIARMDSSNLTQEGQLLGTPNYMAPEQITGSQVDYRADLFSLGVVLYEMLTGRKPFQGDNLTMVAHRIVYDQFTDPRQFVLDLPLNLNTVLERGLAKKPEARYASAREFAKAFRTAVEDRGALVMPELPDIPVPGSGRTADGTSLSPAGGFKVPTTHGAAGLGTATPGAPTLTLPAPPPKVAAPAKPKSALRPLRLVAVAATTTVLALAAAGGAGLWITGQHPSPSPVNEDALVRAQVVPLWKAAQRQAQLGRTTLAVGLYNQAIRLAPGEPRLVAARDQLERAVREAGSGPAPVSPASDLEGVLARAEQALAANNLPEARNAARQALVLDQGSTRAQAVLAAVDRLRPTIGASLPPRPPVGRETPRPPVDPTITTAAVAVVEPATATLQLDFYTEAPEGVVTVYAGNNQLLKETWEFWEKKGFFSKRPKPGRIQSSTNLPKGPIELLVYVQVEGKPTRKSNHDVDLVGGSTNTLRIRVSASGEVDVAVESTP